MRRAAALALAIVVLATGCDRAPRPPDVVLVTLDTTRADRLGCYGYFRDTSPNLDRLAARSVLFENAFAHMSATLPSHVSLLTSTHTVRHGIRGNFAAFDVAWQDRADLRIAGTIFSEAGYVTAGFVSAAPLKAVTGIATGMSTWREPEGGQCPDRETTDAVLAWLDRAPDEPFFLWVHYFDPHDRYAPPAPYDSLFSTDDALLGYLEESQFTFWEHPQIQRINNLYDGEIRSMDAQFGRLAQKLEEMGRFDSAAIVVVADHGEGMGQHDWVGHLRMNDEQLRVPLLVKLPGMTEADGRRSTRVTAVVDVLPTLVEELDLPVSEEVRAQFEGRPALTAPAWDFVFSERTHARPEMVGEGMQFALSGRDWKYMHTTGGKEELYDLRADPWELQNLAARHPDLVDSLRDRVLRRADVPGGAAPDSGHLPAHHLEQLRALGYVD